MVPMPVPRAGSQGVSGLERTIQGVPQPYGNLHGRAGSERFRHSDAHDWPHCCPPTQRAGWGEQPARALLGKTPSRLKASQEMVTRAADCL